MEFVLLLLALTQSRTSSATGLRVPATITRWLINEGRVCQAYGGCPVPHSTFETMVLQRSVVKTARSTQSSLNKVDDASKQQGWGQFLNGSRQ